MNKNWLELSETERNNIEKEWLKTEWYNNVVKEEKNPYSYILGGFCLLWAIVLIIIYVTECSEDEYIVILGGIALGILSFFFFLKPTISKERKAEEEFVKWLLKEHNIIK